MEVYAAGFNRGDGILDALCLELKRSKQTICKKAKMLGITNSKRGLDRSLAKINGEKARVRIASKGHPKGMLNKKHSPQTRAKFSVKQKKRWAAMDPQLRADRVIKQTQRLVESRSKNFNIKRGSWKASWRTIGERHIFFRSAWEANYARYLEHQKKTGQILDWQYEPRRFWFHKVLNSTASYKPDFLVHENADTKFWVEVKGYFDERSKRNLKLFREFYPDEKIILVSSSWFKENQTKLQSIIPEWEASTRSTH